MKKYLLISFIFLTQFCFAALSLTVTNPGKSVDLGVVPLEDGFYGEPAGNITMIIEKDNLPDVYVYAKMSGLMRNSEGYEIPEGVLAWKGYWASINGVNLNGARFSRNDWTPYRLYDDPFAIIQSTDPVSITLGTQISRVPATQPRGTYSTQIIFSITE